MVNVPCRNKIKKYFHLIFVANIGVLLYISYLVFIIKILFR